MAVPASVSLCPVAKLTFAGRPALYYVQMGGMLL